MSSKPGRRTRVGRGPNPPGQDTISYRVGRHGDFLGDMLDSLGDETAARGLTTRDRDEPAIALVDAWATALDVLAFYQERLASESFVRTATELASVLELARAIGYELGPGVAATTWLAFDVSAPPGAPDTFPVDAGTQAQSVPGPGELPQVFETVESITARPGWNAVPLQSARPMNPAVGDTVLRLDRTDLVLQPGDALLIAAGGSSSWSDVRRVRHAEAVEAVLASPTDKIPLIPAHTVVTLDAPVAQGSLASGIAPAPGTVEVHALRQRASLFGYNAPKWDAIPVALRVGEINPHYVSAGSGSGTTVSRVLTGAYSTRQATWADAALATTTTVIHLDQAYPQVVKGSWVVLERSAASAAVRKVASVAEVPHSEFGLSGKTTKVTMSGGGAGGFSPRTTTVLCVSERLDLAPWPLADDVGLVDQLDLDRVVPTLAAGRTVIVSGTATSGEAAAEVATIESVSSGPGRGPRLELKKDLTTRYKRSSVRVRANVAKATHGQSRAELLGSGDNRRSFQRFTLRQKPLTHVTAPTGTGTRTTLAVWVNGVRWEEVATLHGAEPDARVYVTHRADDGTVEVIFGDGVSGARLPTGRDNVVATYRVGIGTDADLEAGRISMPMSRPLGLDAVVNPVPADGSADPETIDRARENAPRTVRTLGRVVSLDDYVDFARGFAGVGKVRGDVLWDGARRVVHLTISGANGKVLPTTSAVPTDLRTAIDDVRHAVVPVDVSPHVDRRFGLKAHLEIEDGRRFEDVENAVTEALTGHFSFDRRQFAQPVAASEVLAVMHGVAGLVAVVLDDLELTGSSTTSTPPTSEPASSIVLPAWAARRLGHQTLAAELLTIDEAEIDLEELT